MQIKDAQIGDCVLIDPAELNKANGYHCSFIKSVKATIIKRTGPYDHFNLTIAWKGKLDVGPYSYSAVPGYDQSIVVVPETECSLVSKTPTSSVPFLLMLSMIGAGVATINSSIASKRETRYAD